MISRRDFFLSAVGGTTALIVAPPLLMAQQGQGMLHDSMVVRDSQNLFAMDQSAAQSVRLPAKPNATPQLTTLERDALERRIHCQCGCTLDVFTCRTTDFSCQVSPAMHRDIIELVRGGYGAQEIIDAFVDVYGQRALMAPKKAGFNLLAWIMPGIAVIAAGAVLVTLLRRWGNRSRSMAATVVPIDRGVDATPDELARLEAAVRGDEPQ